MICRRCIIRNSAAMKNCVHTVVVESLTGRDLERTNEPSKEALQSPLSVGLGCLLRFSECSAD